MSYYTQLKKFERAIIYDGLKQGQGQGVIAARLGRPKSTISREIKRNSDYVGYLYPQDAQAATDRRKAKHGTKVNRDPELMKYVIEKLQAFWAPDAIAGRWTLENSSRPITTEAIYSFIYHKSNKQYELWKLLPQRKKKRGIQRKKRNDVSTSNKIFIEERPAYTISMN